MLTYQLSYGISKCRVRPVAFLLISCMNFGTISLMMLVTYLLCLQKAHVQQFVATEDALNKAAEAKSLSQRLINRLHGSIDVVASEAIPTGGTSQNLVNIRHLEVLCFS